MRPTTAAPSRHSLAADGARPVLEGKQIEPFRVSLDTIADTSCVPEADREDGHPRRARLAYRDVASATNRLTLIAAVIPARAVTTHTLFCLKSPLPADAQQVLCGLLNSFVANYLIRLRVNTHVTVALVSRLPAPVVPSTSPAFETARTARPHPCRRPRSGGEHAGVRQGPGTGRTPLRPERTGLRTHPGHVSAHSCGSQRASVA